MYTIQFILSISESITVSRSERWAGCSHRADGSVSGSLGSDHCRPSYMVGETHCWHNRDSDYSTNVSLTSRWFTSQYPIRIIKKYKGQPKKKSLEDALYTPTGGVPPYSEAAVGATTPYQEGISLHRIDPSRVMVLSKPLKSIGASILPCIFSRENGDSEEQSENSDVSNTPSIQSSSSTIETDCQVTPQHSLALSPNMAYNKVENSKKRAPNGKGNDSVQHAQNTQQLAKRPSNDAHLLGSLTLSPNLAYHKVQRERNTRNASKGSSHSTSVVPSPGHSYLQLMSTRKEPPTVVKVKTNFTQPNQQRPSHRPPISSKVALKPNLAYNQVRNARSEENLVSMNQSQFEKSRQRPRKSSTPRQSDASKEEYDYPITRLGRRRFQGIKDIFERSNTMENITSSTNTQYHGKWVASYVTSISAWVRSNISPG